MKNKNNQSKMKIKEKIAFAVFMTSVPLLIELWKEKTKDNQQSFDSWLMEIYNRHNDKSKKKKGGEK
ncbi:MAG: hypothetical protein DBY22_00590 [Clostridiales bacterium]|nr:MAG: hypothetical protein DBY22_00590 [Clostridiales bacterium]